MLLFLMPLTLSLAYSYKYFLMKNASTEAVIEKLFWEKNFLTVPRLFQSFSCFILILDKNTD